MAGFNLKLEGGVFADNSFVNDLVDLAKHRLNTASYPTADYVEIRRLQFPQGAVDHTLSGWSELQAMLVFNHGPNNVEIQWTDAAANNHKQIVVKFALINDIDYTQLFFVEDPTAGTSEVTLVWIGRK